LIELERTFILPLAPRWVRHSYLLKRLHTIPYTCGLSAAVEAKQGARQPSRGTRMATDEGPSVAAGDNGGRPMKAGRAVASRAAATLKAGAPAGRSTYAMTPATAEQGSRTGGERARRRASICPTRKQGRPGEGDQRGGGAHAPIAPMLHAYSYTICFKFCYTSWHFYAFSGTNLLTRCHSASSLFFAVFVF
jgi:hypothetical protein